jgi:hypothetical protein
MDDNDNEKPLLEELDINFNQIFSKCFIILNPKSEVGRYNDSELIGPLFFCILYGFLLLLSGKLYFGYIYGFSIFGCFGIYGVLNLVYDTGFELGRTCSILGYSMLPIIFLSAFALILNLKGIFGIVLCIFALIYSTSIAVRLFNTELISKTPNEIPKYDEEKSFYITGEDTFVSFQNPSGEQYWLITYPVFLFYCFFLIMILF